MPPTDRPVPSRPETREVSELRALRVRQPELAPAVDMQLELVELLRRLQARVSTPTLPPVKERQRRIGEGQRVLDFADLPLDWPEVRLSARQTADILHRYDLIDRADHASLVVLVREDADLMPAVRRWYSGEPANDGSPAPMLDELLPLAMRPFLARAVDVAQRGLDLSGWKRPSCPFCAGPPDFAVCLNDDERLLICSRCSGRWPWDAVGCVWCLETRAARLPTFLSTDRRYRVCACDSCRKYLKAYNARGAARPVLPVVDLIATLPLDAAAAQRGYEG